MRRGKKKKRNGKWISLDETYETLCRMIEQIPRAENGSGSVNGGSGGGGRVFFTVAASRRFCPIRNNNETNEWTSFDGAINVTQPVLNSHLN